ncbi:MAG TPA: c-type cytochrome domain-containing protein [Chryseosolibacter sp.]
MELFKRVIAYCVLALQVLITVVLIFEKQLSVPAWLQSVGRVHPLILHLPIGLLLITTLIAFGQRLFSESYKELFSFLLFLSAFTASLSAFMGLILSLEGGYTETDLIFHKWLGVVLSFLCWALISFSVDVKILRPALVAGTFILVLTGHFGANLTHGEDFILGPMAGTTAPSHRELSDSSTVFAAAIEPVLEAKCYSCHNDQKAKGKLVLTSKAAIEKGGKNGPLWKAHESLLMDRLNLPIDHKKHMPPKDKAQLTAEEIAFISSWVSGGADFKARLNELPESDSLRLRAIAIAEKYHGSPETSIYKFASASPEKIKSLNTPYRTVFQIAANEPALQADFFLAGEFQSKMVEELRGVGEQLVTINLSKMPVADKDLETLKQFPNLEKLILNQTNIDGHGLSALNGLSNLQILSLSGTKVNAEHLRVFERNRSIKEIYLWNTAVSSDDLEELRKLNRAILWDIGFQPDDKEVLRLSPPILRNEGQVLKTSEKVSYRHNLPGAMIRYSINSDMPDSVSGEIYKEPIALKQYSIIKVKAFKDGWLSSNGAEHIFFPEGFKPDRAELLTKPEDRYAGEGASTLTDGRKGMPDFYRDPVWMGFRNQNLEALFYFDKNAPSISSVTLSYARNVNAMCMPPSEIQLWGGNDKDHLVLLATDRPAQPTNYVSTRIEGADLTFSPAKYACYKLVAKTLSTLPPFRKAPKDKGWLMVDEVFFN